jgi:hypothetical protein
MEGGPHSPVSKLQPPGPLLGSPTTPHAFPILTLTNNNHTFTSRQMRREMRTALLLGLCGGLTACHAFVPAGPAFVRPRPGK